jgi:flagellar biosynthesis/type III secretory pathway chaperone
VTPKEQELHTLLHHEKQCVEQLLEAIKLEREILKRGTPKQVTESTQAKSTIIKTLEKAASACIVWLQQNLPDEQGTTVRAIIKNQFPNNIQLIEILDQIKTQSEECQRLNDINGGVIALSQQYTERALSILHGDTPGNKVYSAEGIARQTYSPKTLGKV